ncbi:MAG: hypothetical protein KKH98_01490 [Spirochaetes bacterium]|nr:hypothetical protein [Spirochaetota bacterium]
MNQNKTSILVLFLLFGICFAQTSVEPIKFKADRIEYIYKKGNEEVICRGNAIVERSDFFLKAQLIRIYGEDRNFVKAFQKIKMVNKIDNVIVYGDYAEYDNISGYAKVFKSPKLVVTNENLEITSAVMETYLNENKSIALGDVKITQTNYTAYSEKAVYLQNRGMIELTGDPKVYQENDMFSAEKIVVYIKKKLIKLYNKVVSKITSK